jgi:hypothetical protein
MVFLVLKNLSTQRHPKNKSGGPVAVQATATDGAAASPRKERSNLDTMEQPGRKGRHSSPDYRQCSVWLSKKTRLAVDLGLSQLAMRHGQKKQFSTLVEELLIDWLAQGTFDQEVTRDESKIQS